MLLTAVRQLLLFHIPQIGGKLRYIPHIGGDGVVGGVALLHQICRIAVDIVRQGAVPSFLLRNISIDPSQSQTEQKGR